ncbi:hypothetical protein NCG89_02975 [Spongiibacter taiwanensis]|uniref:DISARM anti-phage system protein DrmE domain-containing protein n=1 Tax=Spongiibacter taiwanensis TaxID=1748242 RepID=UPI0020351B87|nr:hypothetical protein [Spongiibacter taiwanensis]USA43758.1 hypothetical protein NCG89_02975 [Spongiibacter taiwanensis]
MAQQPQWIEKAQGYRFAIPAFNYIETLACGDVLGSAAAALGYRLRHGQSVWLSAPVAGAADLGHLLCYLHALRMEAHSGVLQSRWFNRINMYERPDLVVWTNRREQFVGLRTNPELGVDMIRANASHRDGIVPLLNPDRVLRTLLAQSSANTLQLCEDLVGNCHPFAMVVDATPYGRRDDVGTLLETLNSYFPSVPVVILTAMGDFHTEQDIARRPFNLWRQPVGRGLFKEKTQTNLRPRILVAKDNTFNEHLTLLCDQGRQVKEAVKFSPSGREAIKAIDQITSALRSLAVPLSFHENHQNANRRGGPYPVKPVSDWLDDLSRVSLSSGEHQELLYLFTQQASQLLEMLEEGGVGKQQAVDKWIKENLKTGTRIAIGVGSERSASLLQTWLIAQYNVSISDGSLSVVGVNSSRDLYRKSTAPIDKLLLVGPLWLQGYWAFTLANNVDLLCYESESYWAIKHGQRWKAYLNGDADSPSWWDLKPSPFRYINPAETGMPVEVWSDCSGQYKHRIELDITLPKDNAWFDILMAPIAEPAPSGAREPDDDDVVVLTDAGRKHSFHRRQRVYVVRDEDGKDKLKRIPAEDITTHDTLLLTDDGSDDCQALLETLISYTSDNTADYDLVRQFSARWEDYVSLAIDKTGSTDAFHKALTAEGIKIGLPAVQGWARHTGIGPSDGVRSTTEHVFAVAKIAGVATKPSEVEPIAKAIQHIRNIHRGLGKDLRRLIANAAVPDREITGSAAKVLNQEVLSDLVRLEGVEKIIQFPHAPKDTVRTLSGLLKDHAEISDRVVVTPRAVRSAEDSNYGNLDKAEKCLSLLENEYFDMFMGDKHPSDCELASRRAGITYAGGMSAVTQGQHASAYSVRYNGKNVDIGRHLRIGSSRDPELCFRTHFHWDDQDKKVVIHHFGRHLPTRKR